VKEIWVGIVHIYFLSLTPRYSRRRSLIRVPLDEDDEDNDEEDFEEVVDSREKVSRRFDFSFISFDPNLADSFVNHYFLYKTAPVETASK
jgi:hypothetical protein